MNVQNMTNPNGNKVPNQFIIQAPDGVYFQSYSTVIAFQNMEGKLQLDRESWNYSNKTSKYRNIFTGLTTKETEKRIKSGEIMLVNLNK
jgi:aromatic ring-opening dioxygenase LigB subunit